MTLLKYQSLHPAKEVGLGGGYVCWVPPRILCVHLLFELYAKQAILTKLKKIIIVVAIFLIAPIISSFLKTSFIVLQPNCYPTPHYNFSKLALYVFKANAAAFILELF